MNLLLLESEAASNNLNWINCMTGIKLKKFAMITLMITVVFHVDFKEG